MTRIEFHLNSSWGFLGVHVEPNCTLSEANIHSLTQYITELCQPLVLACSQLMLQSFETGSTTVEYNPEFISDGRSVKVYCTLTLKRAKAEPPLGRYLVTHLVDLQKLPVKITQLLEEERTAAELDHYTGNMAPYMRLARRLTSTDSIFAWSRSNPLDFDMPSYSGGGSSRLTSTLENFAGRRSASTISTRLSDFGNTHHLRDLEGFIDRFGLRPQPDFCIDGRPTQDFDAQDIGPTGLGWPTT